MGKRGPAENKLSGERIIELEQRGKTNAEIAKMYKLSPSRVSQIKRSAINKANEALRESGIANVISADIVKKTGTVANQFEQLNESVMSKFELLDKATSGDKQVLKKVKEMGISGDKALRLYFQAAQQILASIKTALEIQQRIYDAESNMEFRKVVLEIVQELPPDFRKEFSNKLRQYVLLNKNLKGK